MKKEYCHYLLSLCEDANYAGAVPHGFRLKQSIIEQFDEQFQFKEAQWPKYNKQMVNVLYHAIVDGKYIKERELDDDAKKIYVRCKNKISEYCKNFPRDYVINHEVIFEIANDFNWLLASKKEHLKRKLSGCIQLNDNMPLLRRRLVLFLEDLRQSYEERTKEYPYMEKALKKRRSIVGFSPDENVRWYVGQDMSNEELENLINETKKKIWQEQYLYYILMVTAVRFEHLKRRYE